MIRAGVGTGRLDRLRPVFAAAVLVCVASCAKAPSSEKPTPPPGGAGTTASPSGDEQVGRGDASMAAGMFVAPQGACAFDYYYQAWKSTEGKDTSLKARMQAAVDAGLEKAEELLQGGKHEQATAAFMDLLRVRPELPAAHRGYYRARGLATKSPLPDLDPDGHVVNPEVLIPGHGATASFYIDAFEVTCAQYKRFLDATGHRVPYLDEKFAEPYNWTRLLPSLESVYPESKGNFPVTLVSWEDAQAYATWAGRRLPAAEEWMLASGGAAGRPWPWGDALDVHRANFESDADPFPRLCPVGMFPSGRTPEGVSDLAGNAWEWTSGFKAASDGATAKGLLLGRSYISFDFEPGATCAKDLWVDAIAKSPDTGFRTVRSAP